MNSLALVFGVSLYVASFIAVAYWGNNRRGLSTGSASGWLIYGLTITVYCTSWTFYGAVGSAVERGWEYLAIYLGPALMFSIGLPLVVRLVKTGKRIHSTSIADFISAHYGRSRGLAALITLIAVIGALPYIALQLRSVATTFAIVTSGDPSSISSGYNTVGLTLLVALVLASFAIVFGARDIDATRSNRGLMAAIAFDGVIKLLALIAVATFAIIAFRDSGQASLFTLGTGQSEFRLDRFITLSLLAAFAVVCLPRQFHVTVVEAENPKALVRAAAVFIVYIAAVSAAVLPISNIGAQSLSSASISPDFYVLALPSLFDASWLAIFVFIGGFAAATGMIIVASIALSTMITNDLVAPLLLRRKLDGPGPGFGVRLLFIRRLSVFAVVLTGAGFALIAPDGDLLVDFGATSFAAAAQLAPVLLGAIYWRSARIAGAYAGLGVGFLAWMIFVLGPSFVPEASLALSSIGRLLGIGGLNALTQGVIICLALNSVFFIGGSVVSQKQSIYRGTAHRRKPQVRGGRATPTSGDLYTLIESCLGAQVARDVIIEFERSRAMAYDPYREVDQGLIAFTDQQISKAIGASTARILMRSVLAGGALQLKDVAALLDETTGRMSFSYDLLHAALENTLHGISVVDKDLKLVAWNQAYIDLYDYPAGFLYDGRPIEEVIRFNAERGECGVGETDELVRRRLAHLRAGKRHTFERNRPSGRVVRIEGMRSPGGAYVTTFTDVTPYKTIEQALIKSESSIRFYTDNIPAMIAFSDASGRMRFANEAYKKAFARDSGDITDQLVVDIIGADEFDRRLPYINRVLSGERVTFDLEMWIDGETQHFQVSYTPQLDASNRVSGYFALYQDISARRAAEDALARTNETLEERVEERTQALHALNQALDTARRDAEHATRSKTRFLAAASHDVLQPLNAARLFAAALREAPELTEQTEALASKIDASISSADKLLRSLLDVSKLDAGGIKPNYSDFALQEIFDELENDFAIAAEDKGLKLRVARTALWVRSDRGLLLSALQNLVSNAIRYTDEGRVLIGARRGGDEVRIEVHDTGRGIPAENQREIFNEFNRLPRDASISGAGLGLATVERIARLLAATLSIKSSVGRGSVFLISAQRVTPVAEPVQSSRKYSGQAKPFDGARCLVIDNDQTVLDAMEAALSRWGASVETALSDDAAIEAGKCATTPDLLVVDYQLDCGVTGFDVIERLKKFWGEQPVTIMITATNNDVVMETARAIGVPVLAKPVEPAELRSLITQLTRHAAAE